MQSEIGAELLTAWNRNLYLWFAQYNEEYVGGRLKRPVIELSFRLKELGSWDPSLRRIAISAEHIRRDPWLVVMDTLRHEMAHQYVNEILRVDESPHGSAFKRACEVMRCEPRASQSIGGEHMVIGGEEDRILRVLKKILSLATSPNEHEAQAAVNKARSLLLEYNVDLINLDRDRNFGCITVGTLKGRRATWELWVAMILNEFFFVEVLWARSYESKHDKLGTVLQLFGTQTNLEMAAYVYDYLTNLLPRLWNAYRRARQLDGNRERMRYYAGVVQGFHDKLVREAQLEVKSIRAGGAKDEAVVWQGDRRLREYYRHMNPNVVTRTSGGVSSSDAFRDGVKEGRHVSVRPPLETSDGFGGLLCGGSE